MADRYDLIVIGAGVGGLAAARAARRKGRVALVEAARPGGECTFTGCVPSKTLIDVARRVAAVRNGAELGLHATVDVDARMVLKRVRAVVEEISADESPDVLRQEGIAVIQGHARFLDSSAVDVNGHILNSQRFVIATGSRAAVPAVDGLAELDLLTNENLFLLEEPPSRLAIVGAGTVGCELAQALGRLGVEVVLIEAQERILQDEEPESSETVAGVLSREGIEIRCQARMTRARPGPVLEFADADPIAASHVLVATGRRPSTGDLDLEAAGVDVAADGRIAIDERSRTSASHIYAVGDCAGPFNLTHAADEQGRTAARDAFSRVPRRFDTSVMPWVTFTDPEVGRVGLTEAQAFDRYGERARVAVMPIARTDRGRCSNERDGFVKLIAAPGKLVRSMGGGRLVGMTAVCSAGGELVAEGALLMKSGSFAGRMAQTIHAYPTWSIAVRQAAAQWFTGLDRPAGPPS